MRFELPTVLLGLAVSASATTFLDQYSKAECQGIKLNSDNFDLKPGPQPCKQIGPLDSVWVHTTDDLKVNLYYNSNCGGTPDDVVDSGRSVCRGGHFKGYQVV